MAKTAERFFDINLQALPFSICWRFFNSHIIRNPLNKDSLVTILESDLLLSVETLSQFLHHVKPAAEASTHFAKISSIIGDCRSHWRQSYKAIERSPKTSEGFEKELRAHLRIVRCYGISLAQGLIMHTIVRMYFPENDDSLAQASFKLSQELISLAKQATRLKPLGATFMAAFLNTVWAVGDRDARTQMTPVLIMSEADFKVERAIIMSKKLNGLLDSLQDRILAQSTPAARFLYDNLPRKQRQYADQTPEYHIPSGSWFGCS
jgi:hypothetical protein